MRPGPVVTFKTEKAHESFHVRRRRAADVLGEDALARRLGKCAGGKPRRVSLGLAVFTPDSAQTVRQALDLYHGRAPADPGEHAGDLRAFADEVLLAYGDDASPFTREPVVRSTHVQLTIAPDAWEREAQRLVGAAYEHGLVVLDPQEEKLYPPDSFAVS